MPLRGNRATGFTLIELMISVALVVFLILGVNQVFLYTSQAVGVGEAINTAVRDSRSAQAVFTGDFNGMVPPGSGLTDSGALIIQSSQGYAFRDKADQAASKTGNPAYLDLANSGNEGDSNVPGDIIAPSVYNYRNHRLDTLSFFSRDLFRRQTGNIGTYVDNMACQEAWVWYGHAWLPDNNAGFSINTLPGNGTPQNNPNNIYGSQFVLARVAVLLKEKSVDSPLGTIVDPSGVYQRFYDRTMPYPAATSGGTPASDLQPLAAGTVAAQVPNDMTTNPATGQAWQLQNSRYDLAATTINSFRTKLLSYIANTQVSSLPANYWWSKLMTPTLAAPLNRFQCNPYIAKPIDSAGAAQASPYFLGGCSQFTVEYAGDYISQDNNTADGANYGNGLSASPDGQIDYVLITQPDGTKRKQIVWYGLPRNTSGLSTIDPNLGDVVPLDFWIRVKYGASANPYTFEKTLPVYGNSNSAATMQAGSQYICAWGPGDPKPKLIRITITITDSSGRIPQGLTYQYIYTVP